MTKHPDKNEMYRRGLELIGSFCALNDIPEPSVTRHDGAWPYKCCAYYRPGDGIHISVKRCAHIGVAASAWSYPGYVVDRTPYGVIQHELGHHADCLRGGHSGGKYWSSYSFDVMVAANEAHITNYRGTPSDGPDTVSAEWFAEAFRLFVTNPDLLRALRPRTHARLISDGFKPVRLQTWAQNLAEAPERTFQQARKKAWAAAHPDCPSGPDCGGCPGCQGIK